MKDITCDVPTIVYISNYNPYTHHRKSIRLKGYDYSQAGLYYITICIKDRICLFGKIPGADKEMLGNNLPSQIMILNDAGKIADGCWLEIPEHFPNVVLLEHIIMPNHVHGIIELKRSDQSDITGKNIVGTSHLMSLQNQFSNPIPGSLPVIIQQYKSSVTRFVNKSNGSHFQWQSRYYEHIIRNEQSYDQIADYIINNPKNWKEDDLFKI